MLELELMFTGVPKHLSMDPTGTGIPHSCPVPQPLPCPAPSSLNQQLPAKEHFVTSFIIRKDNGKCKRKLQFCNTSVSKRQSEQSKHIQQGHAFLSQKTQACALTKPMQNYNTELERHRVISAYFD